MSIGRSDAFDPVGRRAAEGGLIGDLATESDWMVIAHAVPPLGLLTVTKRPSESYPQFLTHGDASTVMSVCEERYDLWGAAFC